MADKRNPELQTKPCSHLHWRWTAAWGLTAINCHFSCCIKHRRPKKAMCSVCFLQRWLPGIWLSVTEAVSVIFVLLHKEQGIQILGGRVRNDALKGKKGICASNGYVIKHDLNHVKRGLAVKAVAKKKNSLNLWCLFFTSWCKTLVSYKSLLLG